MRHWALALGRHLLRLRYSTQCPSPRRESLLAMWGPQPRPEETLWHPGLIVLPCIPGPGAGHTAGAPAPRSHSPACSPAHALPTTRFCSTRTRDSFFPSTEGAPGATCWPAAPQPQVWPPDTVEPSCDQSAGCIQAGRTPTLPPPKGPPLCTDGAGGAQGLRGQCPSCPVRREAGVAAGTWAPGPADGASPSCSEGLAPEQGRGSAGARAQGPGGASAHEGRGQSLRPGPAPPAESGGSGEPGGASRTLTWLMALSLRKAVESRRVHTCVIWTVVLGSLFPRPADMDQLRTRAGAVGALTGVARTAPNSGPPLGASGGASVPEYTVWGRRGGGSGTRGFLANKEAASRRAWERPPEEQREASLSVLGAWKQSPRQAALSSWPSPSQGPLPCEEGHLGPHPTSATWGRSEGCEPRCQPRGACSP